MSERPLPTCSVKLILASGSPRRAGLLRQAGYSFDVVPPRVEEPAHMPPDVTPSQHAEALSFFKAASVVDCAPAGLILGADTIVTYENRVFGKPADVNDARATLQTLRGTTHEVITGVTLLDAASGRRDIRHHVSRPTMIPFSDDELEAYLGSGAWVGKAGAYGVQDRADAYIDRIEGSYTNVVGLPMELLARMLAEWRR